MATTDEIEQEIELALQRASVYRLLGSAFAYPVPDRLLTLSSLAESLSAAVPPSLGSVLRRLAAAAREADAAVAAGEHVFLFDRGARCPPYEGAWGEAPQLAGKAALLADIAGFYTAFGLVPSAASPDMEDHVAAELEFMSILAVKEGFALAEGRPDARQVTRDAQRSFLAEHLGRWGEAFAAAVRAATPVPYYQAAADTLEAWVSAEIAVLDAAPDRVRGRLGIDPIREEDTFSCPMVEPDAAGQPEGAADPAQPRG